MKNEVRWASISAAAVVLAAGAIYGVWTAWDAGYVGRSSRAPTVEAVEEAARRQSVYMALRRGPNRTCLNLDLGAPRPEHLGVPGVGPRTVPGQHAWTYLLQVTAREQQARELQLSQLSFLAAQGLLSVNKVQLETQSGALPAVRYQLTWDGYEALGAQESSGTSLCLHYGQRDIDAIIEINGTGEKIAGLDVFEVATRTAIKEAPAWARSDDAKRLFAGLEAAMAPRTEKVKLVRTQEGWRSLAEVELQLQAVSAGRELPSYYRQLGRQLDAKAPTVQEARALIEAQMNDVQWGARNGTACLPVRIHAGGDDADARDTSPFTFVVHDRGDRREHEYKNLLAQLHVLAALESAGLAQSEALNSGRGVRYAVKPEAVSALGLANGGGCIPAGKLRVDLMSMHTEPGRSRAVTRGVVEQSPDWVRSLAAQLPALKVMLDSGISVRADFVLPAEEGQPATWRLGGLSPQYPEFSYTELPPHLSKSLPRTEHAIPKPTPVDAPALVPAQSIGASPAAASAPPGASSPAAVSPAVVPVTASPANAPAAASEGS